MANLSFRVNVFLTNPGVLPELQARMADMQPAFEAIFRRWVDVNEQKFELAQGGELSGAQVFEEFWQGLSSGYRKQKHPDGAPKRKRKATGEYPDWLMVRTGALMQAMEDPAALFQDIEPGMAVFGTPLDPELSDIVRWQALRRPVVFLATPDMNSIRMNIQDYLGMGGDFKQLRSEAGLKAVALQHEVEAMDAEFSAEGL